MSYIHLLSIMGNVLEILGALFEHYFENLRIAITISQFLPLRINIIDIL